MRPAQVSLRLGRSTLVSASRVRILASSKAASIAASRASTMRSFSGSTPSRMMDTTILNDSQLQVQEAVGEICAQFGDKYWRERDQTVTYPFEFHKAMADGGWLGVALPERFGGSGLGMMEAAIMMQTITESGGGFPSAQCTHANIYATQPLGIFGTDEQRAHFIPKIVNGEYRTCFAVTEPNVGLNTLELRTTATQLEDGRWSLNGQKIWITNAQQAHVMILLARTTPLDELKKKSEGLSLFIIPVDKTAPGLEMRKIRKMGGNCVDSNEIFFDNYIVPEDSIIGGLQNKGKGFKIILHGMNSERILIGAEALGIGYAALKKATQYATDRVVFNRPISQNQGVAHPLADAYMQMHAASLSVYHAAKIYDQSQIDSSITQEAVGAAANSAKYLAAEAAYNATQRAILAHGGMGFAAEFDVERYHRESWVPRLAPISREMILNYISERVLKFPKSY